jgi:hypothetical protein
MNQDPSQTDSSSAAQVLRLLWGKAFIAVHTTARYPLNPVQSASLRTISLRYILIYPPVYVEVCKVVSSLQVVLDVVGRIILKCTSWNTV